jgi:PAS domain-containing protein
LRAKGLSVPFVLFTGKGREDVAVAALNNGADFYVRKGGDVSAQFAELKNTVRHLAHAHAMEVLMQGVYEAAPMSIMLVDGDRRILMLNRAASELSCAPRSSLIGVRCGVAFGCDNAKEDERGCGFGSQCPNCRLWATGRRAIEAGETCRRVEACIPTSAGGRRRDVRLMVSATPFVHSGRTHALVCIEDMPEGEGSAAGGPRASLR